MKFWGAFILSLMVALGALAGLGIPDRQALSVSAKECAAVEARVRVSDPDASEKADVAWWQSSDDSSQEQPQFTPKKRSRKCWRPEQRLLETVLVPVTSPAEGVWQELHRPETPGSAVAACDVLFTVSGYVRLFQKA